MKAVGALAAVQIALLPLSGAHSVFIMLAAMR